MLNVVPRYERYLEGVKKTSEKMVASNRKKTSDNGKNELSRNRGAEAEEPNMKKDKKNGHFLDREKGIRHKKYSGHNSVEKAFLYISLHQRKMNSVVLHDTRLGQ